MLRARSFASLLFVLTAYPSCGGEAPPPVVAPPPPVVEVAKPAVTQARWVFPEGRRRLTAKLDLGGAGTLYVGRNGIRRLVKGAEPPVDAPTLALRDMIGVLRSDKGQILLVTAEGDVLTAADPLGPLEALHPGPLGGKPGASADAERFAWSTTGRAAILGLTQDGRLLRSADYGATWQESAYGGSGKRYGHPASVELDGQGNGLLLHFPQRLFVTHDDGATWTHLPSPGIGATEIRRDGEDRIWLIGRYERARLEGSALKVTADAPAPLVTPPPPGPKTPDAPKDPNQRRNARTLLSGDHTVELAEIYRHGKVREVEVSSARLGDKPDKPSLHPELVGASGLSRHVAGYDAALVYLREDDDVDPSAPTTTVFRSSDYGVTFREDVKLKGAEPIERTGVDVAAGPDGWTFVTALCPRYSPEGRTCAHRQVRPAGASAFEDMQFDEELTPVAFAFDREHDRVYALGIHNGTKHLYESPLTQNRFSRTHVLDVPASTSASLTVDPQGTVRVLAFEGHGRGWVLHRRPFGGEALPLLYVPLGNGALALARSRGLLFAAHEIGWETHDGGESWTRTAGVSASWMTCTETAGCLDDDGTERVGWDHEAALGDAPRADDRVTASPEPPKQSGAMPPAAEPASPPVDAVCKLSGPVATVTSVPGSEMVDSLSADVRWASFKRDADGKASVVFGSKSQVKDTQLLPAAPKVKAAPDKPAPMILSADRVLNDGVVAARYRQASDAGGHRQPLEIDLAWWSAATGRSHHQTLHKVPPFYVSTWSFTGTPQIVDGGLLYQPPYAQEVYFVHDDGKVETLSIPGGASVRNAERIGKGWLLADAYNGNVQLLWSNEGGKEWSHRDWRLDGGGTALMALIDGKATVSFARGSLPSALFVAGPSPENDPPAPVVIDPATIDGRCDAHAATLRATSYIPSAERLLRARVEVAKDGPPAGRLSVSQRVTHSTSAGAICTSAFVLNGPDPRTYETQTAFLYPEAKGWSGWWFHRAPDPKDATKKVTLASPLSCEPGPAEAHR
jgi:hypothetical protein